MVTALALLPAPVLATAPLFATTITTVQPFVAVEPRAAATPLPRLVLVPVFAATTMELLIRRRIPRQPLPLLALVFAATTTLRAQQLSRVVLPQPVCVATTTLRALLSRVAPLQPVCVATLRAAAQVAATPILLLQPEAARVLAKLLLKNKRMCNCTSFYLFVQHERILMGESP